MTQFPVAPILEKYDDAGPVIKDNGDGTYIVSEKLILNSMKEHLYIKLISDWKDENKID